MKVFLGKGEKYRMSKDWMFRVLNCCSEKGLLSWFLDDNLRESVCYVSSYRKD